MKLIHCADIHLDSRMGANLSKDQAKERRREILNTFVKMVNYAKENHVDAILISGDLFDVRNASALSKNTFRNLVWDNPEILFFYLRGNHDDETPLNVFDDMPDNLFLFSDSWSGYGIGENKAVMIYGIELNSENCGSSQMSFAPDPSKINIVMLHGQDVDGAGPDKAETINLKQFRNKGINYMALGHVHAYKRENLDGEAVYCYPGCLEGRGFDETGDHGFVVLDIDEDKGIIKDSFVSFANRRLYEIRVDVTGLNSSPDMINAAKKNLNESGAGSIDMVKVVLCGCVDVECEKDVDYIKHALEANYYFLKVYDKTELKVDPETYRYDSSLKGEFVRTVLNDDSLSEEEKGEIVRLGLNVLMGGKPEL